MSSTSAWSFAIRSLLPPSAPIGLPVGPDKCRPSVIPQSGGRLGWGTVGKTHHVTATRHRHGIGSRTRSWDFDVL